ncbi:MAG: DUF4010 domain-containing protein [Candidatus Njordarchaeota archaeon]
MIDLFQSFQFKLIIAFIVGSIIGLERQFTKEIKEAETPIEGPGVRSFGLLSLLGAATIILEQGYHVAFLTIIGFVGVLIWVSLFLVYNIVTRNELNLTTSLAAILAYILGLFVGVGEFYWAIIISVFITAILSMKHKVVELLRALEYREISSALQIAILALLILPIIPPIIILEAINLRIFLVFLIFVLAVEFLGYIAVRHLGEKKGLVAFAWLGALVHSETTTVEITRMYNKLKPKLTAEMASMAILIVDTTLILRSVLFLSFLVFNIPEMIMMFLLSVALSIVFGIALAYIKFKKQEAIIFEKSKLLTSPLSYSSAIKMATILFVISLLVVFFQKISYELTLVMVFVGGLFSVTGAELAIASMLIANKIDILGAIFLLNLALCAGIVNKVLYIKLAGGDKWILIKVIAYTVILVSLIALSYIFISTPIFNILHH